MKILTVRDAAEIMNGQYFGEKEGLNREITHAVIDSRAAAAGALFFCFAGEKADGHDFARDALSRGAAAVAAERPAEGGAYILVKSAAAALAALAKYRRDAFAKPVVAVVGSVGKTTAKEMTAAALGAKFSVLKTEKNLNNALGLPLTLSRLTDEYGAAVLELGVSDFGEMAPLAELARPDIVVFTRVAESHLEQFIDLDGVLREKSEVFRFVPRGGLAVLCGDDALLRGFDPGIGKQTFGFAPDCDARAEFVIADGTDSVSFDIARGESRLRVRLNAYGSHLPSAAAAAALVAANLGLSDGEIRRGLETYRAVEGRANIIKTDTLTIIDDCYNANAASMTAALESLRVQRGRRVAVLGDMFELGEHSGDLHRAAGALAAECCDLLICCGRSAEFYFKGCTAADSGCGKYHFPFADALLERLPELVRPGDTVLVKASHGMNFPVIVDKLKEIG